MLENLLHLIPHMVPVEIRLAAESVLHSLQGVIQFGAGIEEAFTRLIGHLKAQA